MAFGKCLAHGGGYRIQTMSRTGRLSPGCVALCSSLRAFGSHWPLHVPRPGLGRPCCPRLWVTRPGRSDCSCYTVYFLPLTHSPFVFLLVSNAKIITKTTVKQLIQYVLFYMFYCFRYMFKSWINLELIFCAWCRIGIQLYSFADRRSVSPVSFIIETVISLLHILGFFVTSLIIYP